MVTDGHDNCLRSSPCMPVDFVTHDTSTSLVAFLASHALVCLLVEAIRETLQFIVEIESITDKFFSVF